jgi:agmatine deiminase
MNSNDFTPGSPAAEGWRMPAEWAPHRATWLTWPRPEGISFPDSYEPIPAVYAGLIRHLSAVEEVNINVWNAEKEEEVRSHLTRNGCPLDNVRFHHFPAYEPWCRDHGPIFVTRRNAEGRTERAVVDWLYNAWGNKYPPYDLDDVVPQRVAALRGLPVFSPGIVMEGGALDVNGEGTLLTTESCLLNPNRNPDLTREEIERKLRDFLGVRHILWLGDGIAGDDTDGHVDDLTRFVRRDAVVTVLEEDPADENYEPLQENLRRLRTMRDQDGRPLEIFTLPMPRRIEREGQRLPASYANFYIANGIVLVPTFRDPRDAEAIATLQRAFPGRRVIGHDSLDLIWGLGSFHCITQQEPA